MSPAASAVAEPQLVLPFTRRQNCWAVTLAALFQFSVTYGTEAFVVAVSSTTVSREVCAKAVAEIRQDTIVTSLTPLDADKRQAEIIKYISTLVGRYKSSPALEYWQVENEPLLEFGTCPDWYYAQGTSMLEAEVAAVRSLDPTHQIIISDTGELSTWTDVAKIADIVGVTMYRSSWDATEKTFGLNPYTFLAPQFYAAKAAYIESVYKKPVISIELQAEPWASQGLAEASLEEQALSMNPELFRENIQFAKEAALGRYYFWGAEWWYKMKIKHNQPEIWEEARKTLKE